MHVSGTDTGRCEDSIQSSLNSFVLSHHVNKDLLKSFWDGVHKPSLYAAYLGFLVMAGICQHTFTVVVAEMSCIHRYCSSVAL